MGRGTSQARRRPLRFRRIALLTDFGLAEPYVGQMKGVLAGRAPRIPVLDLCHGVPPQDVRWARFFLRSSLEYFPEGTLFVCVVDPGVGTERRILWARTGRHAFLAPDNGLLSGLPLLELREVSNRSLFLPRVSSTFHGRDCFAPAAAALANGLPPGKLGPRLDVKKAKPGKRGRIVFVDRFGNAVSDVETRDVPRGAALKLNGRSQGPLRRTYSDVPEGKALALEGSFGTVEFAVRGGSFERRFRVRPGDEVGF